jgi:uncharacterized protein (DUF427 family)
MKVVWNGTVLAESEQTIMVEGNHYFPADSVDLRYLRPAAMRSVCPWKGLASYYSVEVDGREERNVGWTYRHPLPWIRRIRGHVAFWDEVEIQD